MISHPAFPTSVKRNFSPWRVSAYPVTHRPALCGIGMFAIESGDLDPMSRGKCRSNAKQSSCYRACSSVDAAVAACRWKDRDHGRVGSIAMSLWASTRLDRRSPPSAFGRAHPVPAQIFAGG
jgi:hypothetical protein